MRVRGMADDVSRMPRFSKPDTRVHDALRRIGPLPVLGGTVARIRTLADDPNGTTSDLVAVIESDEAFAANLLRYANSAANARPIRARTIRQAVTLLGRRALVRIALEAATYRFLERFPGGAHLSRGQLHVHAVTVAAYSYTTAELRGAHTDTAHLAGLLHDVGKLLMPAAFGVVRAGGDRRRGARRRRARRARAQAPRPRPRRRGRAAGRPDRARRRRHQGDRLPPRRPDRPRLPDPRGRLRADRRLGRAPAGRQRDRPHAARRSRSRGSARAPSCSTRWPSAPASPRRGATGDLGRGRRPAGGRRPHRRPDRPAQPPQLDRRRPPRARRRHRRARC